MLLSSLLLTVLPALALAQDDGVTSISTTTRTSTTVITRTITLAIVHPTNASNSSTASTGRASGSAGLHPAVPTSPLPGVNAGAALEIGKMGLVSVAGMLVVALM